MPFFEIFRKNENTSRLPQQLCSQHQECLQCTVFAFGNQDNDCYLNQLYSMTTDQCNVETALLTSTGAFDRPGKELTVVVNCDS